MSKKKVNKKEVKVEKPHEKEFIKVKQLGRKLIVTINNKTFSKATKDEKEVTSLTNKVKMYLKKPSKETMNTLLNLFDTKKIEDEIKQTELKGRKSTIKKEIKDNKKVIGKRKAITKALILKAKEYNPLEECDLLVSTNTGGLALRGCEHIEMPPLLVKRLEELVDAEQTIQSLLNFWSLCLLNPNEVARTKLFDYLSRHKLLLTPSGYFVTYRMVKKTDVKGVYVDAHTGNFRHALGEISKMDRKLCDEDGGRDCSKGLHTGTPEFIGLKLGDGYSGSFGTGYDAPSTQSFDNTFGNQAVICLVNPAHVVSVPTSDTRKMRACEIYLVKETTPEEVLELQLNDYLVYDQDYQKHELKQLQELLKGKEIKAFMEAKDNSKSLATLNTKLEAIKQEGLKLSSDIINPKLDNITLRELIRNRQIVLTTK